MLSVIVPAYNEEETLGDCLAALRAQSPAGHRYEIIVVDDGSTDGTAEVARRAGVRLVCQPNAGPAAARNHGARLAAGDLFLFTDADCAPAADWIARMVEPFADPQVVGAKGVYRTRQRELVARFVQVEYEERYARMAGRERIDFVDTYAAAYRRDVFLANGGFDARFMINEDQEFSFRLARQGQRLVFVPRAVVFHRHVRTLGAYGRRKFRIGYWKARVLRRYPERAVQDSHTPQLLKVQMGLVALLALALLAAPFWTAALWIALGLAALFLLTTAPFVVHAARRDPAVAAAAPLLLAWRALTLGAGLTVGLVRWNVSHDR